MRDPAIEADIRVTAAASQDDQRKPPARDDDSDLAIAELVFDAISGLLDL